MKKLFTPFEREEKSTTNKIQGTGLGMAITKNLVELMKGDIQVESTPGEGTCFTLRIPFDAAESSLETYQRALCGKRVLVLTSDAQQGAQLRKMLEKLDSVWLQSLPERSKMGNSAPMRLRTSGRNCIISISGTFSTVRKA